MATAFPCPWCHAEIPAADVNVAADLALCRTCGKTSAFSAISGPLAISMDVLDDPPRHIRVTKDFREGLTLTYRKVSGVLFFLVPFTALWSGFSMWGIYIRPILRGTLAPGQALFGIPFLLGTVVLLGIIAFLAFGRWVITLRPGSGSVFLGVGALGWTRPFGFNRESVIALRQTQVKVNNVPQTGILVRHDGRDFLFGALLREDAKRYIAAMIMKFAQAG